MRKKARPDRRYLNLVGRFGPVADAELELCRAGENDHDAIVRLIDGAAQWLRLTQDTDQWAHPWRSEEERSNRIRRDLARGKTWLLRDDGIAVATITADSEPCPIWTAERQREPAVYARRLVVGRDHAGLGLGTALLDWAGLTARRGHRAQWIRVDVWSTNRKLHSYYERQGFTCCGRSSDPDSPSGVLFQKPTAHIDASRVALFHQV